MIEVRSEMVASVWKITASIGEAVQPDSVVVVLESMKMEIPVLAGAAGTIDALHVSEGDSVDEDGLIATIRP
ncbi:biotinylated protein TB7.3 [Microbacterium faecale]|uniref:Biotinylated protein TB7.3 n=1 Tax=Microbacterium faecale TaxID=1804630 RepID=A0A917DEG2_9MICO|nr:biotin/lipoyl-binding carrier protein [Microbacterium faecale]GGD31604.1 biotinylated protein TB7.3 [Microbacterium faecale]